MAATSSWGSAMGQAERRIEAGYQKVVLVGYVVAVETVEAWPWLERFVRAIKRQQRKPAPPPMF